MNKLFFSVPVLALAFGFFGLAQAQNEKPAVDEVLTAIDVAELISRGSSEPDIVNLLSSRQKFDAASARNKGKTDEQIIAYLIDNQDRSKKGNDRNQSIRHRTDGDKYFLEAQYKKAAKEYASAIAFSKEDYTPYKLRGDAYKKYLTAEFSQSPGTKADEAKNDLLKKTRVLLCRSIYSDYTKATEIIDEAIRKNIAEINAIKFRMEQRSPNYEAEDKASPSRSRTAQEIKDMRHYRTLTQIQGIANQAKSKMKMAVADYKLACEKEDAARREFIKTERENKREKKWARYIETEEFSYFYDKAGIARVDDNLEVWTRRENMNDEASADVSKIRINCGKSSSATLYTMKYDEMGEEVSKVQNDNLIMSKIFPGSMEERLFKEVCK
jgi:hypothetical protein